jgi:carbon catabolite-derepressing protein kinase
MAGRPKPELPGISTSLDANLDATLLDTPPQEDSTEARRRRVTGSSTNLSAMATKPAMQGMTPIENPLRSKTVKHKPTKWQFGIRSRNQPAEAMLAIYKALKAMGADWQVPRFRKPGSHLSGSRSRSRSRSRSGSESESDGDGDEQRWEEEAEEDEQRRPLTVRNGDGDGDGDGDSASTSTERGRGRDRKERLGPENDWGYSVPEDPWVINARFRKEGMLPPGAAHPSSAHSSRVDLTSAGVGYGSSSSLMDTGAYAGPASTETASSQQSPSVSRSTSIAEVEGGVQSSDPGNIMRTPSTTSYKSGSARHIDSNESVYVYLTIQLYTIEHGFFLVDFKCAGYENLVREVFKEVREYVGKEKVEEGTKEVWRRLRDGEVLPENSTDMRDREELVGQGRATTDKRATSPFPFLDVASGLIIQLAEGD